MNEDSTPSSWATTSYAYTGGIRTIPEARGLVEEVGKDGRRGFTSLDEPWGDTEFPG